MLSLQPESAAASGTCFICGGVLLRRYERVTDVRYSTPGEWSVDRCEGCGLHSLEPPPAPEVLTEAYRDYYTHDAAYESVRSSSAARWRRWYETERHGADPSLQGACLSRLCEWIHPGGWAELGRDVLNVSVIKGAGLAVDVGAGDGTVVAALRRLGWQAEGVEVDRSAVDSAVSRGLPVRRGSLQDAGYQDSVADLVTMRHVIEHVDNPAGLLHEAARILRPGGRMVIVTPNALSLGHRCFGKDWFALDPPRHLNLFTVAALSRLVQGLFAEVRIATTAQGARGIWAQSRSIRRTGRVVAVPSRTSIISAISFQLGERLLTAFGLEAGEELWLEAVAPLNRPGEGS